MNMKIEVKSLPAAKITCSNCAACCCRLEVLLITDTGVPDALVAVDKWGGSTMRRLEDGWCAALDRNTMLCTIYEKRPLICREFAMGSDDCIAERQATL
jgi:Fe-S-cluster containining protein